MLDRARLFASSVAVALFPLLALTTVACSKTEAPSEGATTVAASAAPSESVAPVAKAAPAPVTDASTSVAEAAVAAPAAASSAAAATCGTKPLPDCPLQAWMKAHTNPAVSAKDFPALATALDKVATFAPAGYTNWASIAKDGAKAARAEDMNATKASCRGCHDQYKSKYKAELRTQKI